MPGPMFTGSYEARGDTGEDWFEAEKRKRGIAGDPTVLAGSGRNPYKSYDTLEAGFPGDPDVAAARRFSEANSGHGGMIRGIVDGKEYTMPTKGRDVRGAEAIRLMETMRAKRVSDEQLAADKAEREYGLKQRRDTDAMEMRKRQMELAKLAREEQRGVDMRQQASELRKPRGFVQGFTDKVGLTKAPDARYISALDSGDPTRVDKYEAEVASEAKVKKQAAVELLQHLAAMPGLDPDMQGRVIAAGAKEAGVNIPFDIGGTVAKSSRASMPITEVVKRQPYIEQTIQNFVRGIGSQSDKYTTKPANAAQGQEAILKFASEVANSTGGNATEIATYIINEIKKRSGTLPETPFMSRDVATWFGPTTREQYAQQLLAGYGGQPTPVQ